MSARRGTPTGTAPTWGAPFSLLLLLTLLSVAACDRELPVEPPEEEAVPGEVVASLSCEGSVVGGLACVQETDDVPEGMSAAIIGGQDVYVQLMQHAFTWDGGTLTLTSDISVKNLTQQVLGSSDGTMPHDDGVRIFFHSGPTVTSGHGGEVTVDNADDTGTFTGTDQEYFQYDQMLVPGKRSLPRTWQFSLPHPDATFSFQVYVTAAVPDEGTIEEIQPGSTVKLVSQSISAGSDHSCGITTDGDAYCWGSDQDDQLGNGGTTGDQASPSLVVAGDAVEAKWSAISAGRNHTCGITTVGDAYCWGNGQGAKLGDGGVSLGEASPSLVVDGDAIGAKWAAISAGSGHTCGITTDGEAFCWGSEADGKLGNGETTSHQSSPSAVVVSDAGAEAEWVTITAGSAHTCGITAAGDAYCWGRDDQGQLGNGGVTGDQSSPSLVVAGDAGAAAEWMAITAAVSHTCGITAAGDAYCWGEEYPGQLGNGGTTGTQVAPSLVVGGEVWVTITAGGEYTCGITTAGDAYCWGGGFSGQLGNGGTPATQETPSLVVAGDAGAEAQWTAISASLENQFEGHTCGVTTAGAAYCWGEDFAGMLGNGGTTGSQDSPSAVVNGHLFARLDADPAPCTGAALLARTGCGYEMYALGPVTPAQLHPRRS